MKKFNIKCLKESKCVFKITRISDGEVIIYLFGDSPEELTEAVINIFDKGFSVLNDDDLSSLEGLLKGASIWAVRSRCSDILEPLGYQVTWLNEDHLSKALWDTCGGSLVQISLGLKALRKKRNKSKQELEIIKDYKFLKIKRYSRMNILLDRFSLLEHYIINNAINIDDIECSCSKADEPNTTSTLLDSIDTKLVLIESTLKAALR